ncbi:MULTISPECIES: LysR family transcriptional regulator [Actinoplanes]|uniref:LysR family transcriptional regulator n=1 Tax=Actinoplanes TaxID=1865 RepID=UPI0005F28748|nr:MULTISPECIES: LysR family transcriptional regulator [Actinoplanes]GLY04321.1 LysR family transcriptional regulator [Actinoplanes sp. NBRC 101535]
MELRQLSYVEAVARHGGFTRAAERLHVAQSAVSAQIRALEAEIGVPLFARTTRKVALTPAGEMFVARARRVLAELDGARAELGEITTVSGGRVAIGAAAVGGYDLPRVLGAFRDRFPDITVRLRSGPLTGLLGALDEGDLDLVVGPVYVDLPPRFEALPLLDEYLVLAVPPGHALDRPARLNLTDTRDEPYAGEPPGSLLRWILTDAARSAGFTPRVQYESPHPAGVRALVAAGCGVALLTRQAAEAPAGPPIVVRHLHPPPLHPPIGVLHHRDRPLPAAAVTCRHHLAEASPNRPIPSPVPVAAPAGGPPDQPDSMT